MKCAVPLDQNKNTRFNPQTLWGYISENIKRAPIDHPNDDEIDLCSFPSSTWREIAETGRMLRRNSEAIFGFDPSTQKPPELQHLYDVLLVAEDAEMLQKKLKKIRVKKQQALHIGSTCKYCWRDIDIGSWCELHAPSTAERKKADRRMKLYSDQLTKVRIELKQSGSIETTFTYLNRWAEKNDVSLENKSLLLERLDGRGSTDYSISYLLQKQCSLLNLEPHQIQNHENLVIAVLLRAEAYLRADALVISRKS